MLEESLLLNTATELFNEEDFNYKHSLSGDESVNVLPAVGNAILLAAGLNPRSAVDIHGKSLNVSRRLPIKDSLLRLGSQVW